MTESNTAPTLISATMKRVRAVELRQEGATFHAIAEILGCSRSEAHGFVMDELDRLAQERDAQARALRCLELERLDALSRAVWPQAEEGEPAAVDRALAIIDRRCRLLGLDRQPPEVSPRGGEQTSGAGGTSQGEGGRRREPVEPVDATG